MWRWDGEASSHQRAICAADSLYIPSITGFGGNLSESSGLSNQTSSHMVELVQSYSPTHLPTSHFKVQLTFEQPHKLDVADSTVLLIIGYCFRVELQSGFKPLPVISVAVRNWAEDRGDSGVMVRTTRRFNPRR